MRQSKKAQISALAEALALLWIMPVWVSYLFQTRLFGSVRACLVVSQRAAQWTGLTGIYRRRALFRQILSRVGKDVSISIGTVLTKPTIELGNSVYIGSYCILGNVRVGDNTLIADHVSIISGHHAMAPDQPIKDQPESYETITIGEDCWVGSRAVVLADLGDHCVVGAGSVVTKAVDEYLIVAGNPAKPIGNRHEHKVPSEW